MQSRHTVPGWFGIGSALEAKVLEKPENLALLQKMYESWPFWTTVVDNCQMILAKADMTIARLYADLVEDRANAEKIFSIVRQEYERSVKYLCLITGQKKPAGKDARAAKIHPAAKPLCRFPELSADCAFGQASIIHRCFQRSKDRCHGKHQQHRFGFEKHRLRIFQETEGVSSECRVDGVMVTSTFIECEPPPRITPLMGLISS